MGTEETKFKSGDIVIGNSEFPGLKKRLWILVNKKRDRYDTWNAVLLQDPSETCVWHETFLCKL